MRALRQPRRCIHHTMPAFRVNTASVEQEMDRQACGRRHHRLCKPCGGREAALPRSRKHPIRFMKTWSTEVMASERLLHYPVWQSLPSTALDVPTTSAEAWTLPEVPR